MWFVIGAVEMEDVMRGFPCDEDVIVVGTNLRGDILDDTFALVVSQRIAGVYVSITVIKIKTLVSRFAECLGLDKFVWLYDACDVTVR
jgi:hypothetical protein